MKRFNLGLAPVAAMLCLPAAAGAQYLGAAPGTPAVGFSMAPAAPLDPVVAQLLHAPAPAMVIHVGDTLDVSVLEIEKYEYKVRVETNGTVNLPLMGSVPVAGERLDEAVAAMSQRLESQGMVNQPHVYVDFTEQTGDVVTVSGEVGKPDVFSARGVPTLYAAISRAGGLKDTASNDVMLIRPGAPQVYQIALGTNPQTSPAGSIPVFAGDQIVVGKLGTLYVVGAVKLSGAYPLKNTGPMTPEQAVALAGGMGYEADKKDARVVRQTASGLIEIPLDLRKEGTPKESSPVLQANDILFIPTNQMKAALKGGGAGIAVSLAAASIYRF